MKPTVYLALPTHGRPEAASMSSAILHATAGKYAVTIVSRDCSLLAHGFNISFVEFLRGNFDYFAMLHSDVAASRFWLDTLIGEMGQYPVMHAPCRMKDDKELVSTALGHMDRPFAPCRRLSMKELFRLPPTFGYTEASNLMQCNQDGWCLLPNTGCFVVDRARFPVHVFPGFEIRSCIVKNAVGMLEAAVESEDWSFGRWCAQRAIRVGCTSKVTTRHFGTAEYTTEKVSADGEERDMDYERALRESSLLL